MTAKQLNQQRLNLPMHEVRTRAAALGYITQGEFRARLGWNVHWFTTALAKGELPAVKFTLSNGEKFFNRAEAEAFCASRGK